MKYIAQAVVALLLSCPFTCLSVTEIDLVTILSNSNANDSTILVIDPLPESSLKAFSSTNVLPSSLQYAGFFATKVMTNLCIVNCPSNLIADRILDLGDMSEHSGDHNFRIRASYVEIKAFAVASNLFASLGYKVEAYNCTRNTLLTCRLNINSKADGLAIARLICSLIDVRTEIVENVVRFRSDKTRWYRSITVHRSDEPALPRIWWHRTDSDGESQSERWDRRGRTDSVPSLDVPNEGAK